MDKNKQFIKAKVLSQTRIDADIYDLGLEAGPVAEKAVPGQFVSVYSNDKSRLLPRPISICETDKAEGTLRLVYRIAGEGTREFSGLSAGDTVDVLGPLGNGFPLERMNEEKTAFLVGGGIGIPPLVELAKRLPGKKQIILGYRSGAFLEEDFRNHGSIYIASEDGSIGTKGNVLDCIREHSLSADVMYACGPTPMLRALQTWAMEQGMEAWLSLEQRMACGIGACLACVCKTKEKDEHSQVNNARICAEGPVFRAEDVCI